MRFSSFAISLNVPDVAASAEFAATQLGFAQQLAADGFCSLQHAATGTNLIFLQVGLATFKPAAAAGPVDGLLVVFTVDDVDDQYRRLTDAGVSIVTPIETEPWGERYFQLADPNGVIYQFVQWVDAPDPQYAGVAG